jgi:CheY-like chemotaxis protein
MTEKSRVLIVDDDTSLCRTLALILTRKGHEAVTVEDGARAVAAAGEGPFDLILIDVLMPGMNGVDTLRELKAVAPQARMVMMTGYAVAGLVTEAIKAGVDGVLYKPFDVEIVLDMLMTEDVLRLYQGYLTNVWQRITPILGARTAQGVFSGTVTRYIQQKAPLLAGVTVSEAGFDLDGLQYLAANDDDSLADLRNQLRGLLAEVFDMLGLLAGNILTDPLIGHLSDRLKGESI